MSKIAEKTKEKHEYNALEALRKAKQQKDTKHQTIEITGDDGEVLFSFKIRPLTDAEIKEIRNLATRKVNGKEIFDPAKSRNETIFKATVKDENGQCIWNNREFMDEIDTVYYGDVIDEVLRSGDKVKIELAIDRLSGFGEENTNVNIEEELKN